MHADYHIHTVWCGHARGTMEQYVRRAVSLGMPEIGFSPHLPMEIPIPEKCNLTRGEMEILVKEYQRLKAAYAGSIVIRLGGEADFFPGREAEVEKLRSDYNLEYLIGSAHFLGDWPVDHPHYIDGFRRRPVDEIFAEYFDVLAEAAATGLFDVIGHLDLPKKFGFRPQADVCKLAHGVIQSMARHGVAFEINTAGRDKPVGEFYPSAELVGECCRAGVKLTLGSDSHAPEEVGRYFDEAAAVAKSAGYTKIMRLNPEKELVNIC